MPYREDLEAALAHAESAEQELIAARDENAADHKRIAELEDQLAAAKRGVQQTTRRDPPAGVAVRTPENESSNKKDAEPVITVGAAVGRLQLHHAGLLVLISGLIALAGTALVFFSFLVWGFEPAIRHGYDAFLCSPRCYASLGGQMLPLGGALLVVGLALVYYFRKPTRRRVERGKIQGGFQWRDLRNLDLGKLGLTQCVFDNSDMGGVKLNESQLGQCVFNGADMRGARVDGSTFTQCEFKGADLRGAKLDGATFTQCEFGRSDLRGASLEGASFGQCHFGGAQLEDVSLNKTSFQQCDLRGTELARARGRLEGATLEQCEV